MSQRKTSPGRITLRTNNLDTTIRKVESRATSPKNKLSSSRLRLPFLLSAPTSSAIHPAAHTPDSTEKPALGHPHTRHESIR
ncbi:hypothetical protein HYQ46_010556 [Verticillium longisporum]|nr:hypothetical protein HYQ46_010556 [Verticillium longisporum]